MQNQWAEILIVGTSLFFIVLVMTRPLGVKVFANWPGDGLNYSLLLFGFNIRFKKKKSPVAGSKSKRNKSSKNKLSKNKSSKNILASENLSEKEKEKEKEKERTVWEQIRSAWWFDAGVRPYLLRFAVKTLVSLLKLPSVQLEKLHWKLGLEEPEVLGTICASMAVVRGVPGGEKVVFEPDFEQQTIALHFSLKGFIRLYALGFFILLTLARFPWGRSVASWVRVKKTTGKKI